jgi:hypothetical protein
MIPDIMADSNTLSCGVCGETFSKKANKVKHERFSKSCGGKLTAEGRKGSARLECETDKDVVKVVNITESELKLEVELVMESKNVTSGELTCLHCLYTFYNVSNMRRHKCLLEPHMGPEYKVLRLLDPTQTAVFKAQFQYNTPFQLCRTALSLGIAVPGLFPWFFPAPQSRGLSAPHLQSRLLELGSVGRPAYTALRKAAQEGEIILPLRVSILLPDGGMLSVGPDLTVPSHQHMIRGLRMERGPEQCRLWCPAKTRSVPPEKCERTDSEDDSDADSEDSEGDWGGKDETDDSEDVGGKGGTDRGDQRRHRKTSGDGGRRRSSSGGRRSRSHWVTRRSAPAPRRSRSLGPAPSRQQQILISDLRNPHFRTDEELYQVVCRE